jgi:hypothetical protein
VEKAIKLEDMEKLIGNKEGKVHPCTGTEAL